MSFYENLTEFKGQPVVDWEAGSETDFASTAVRLRVSYDEADEGVTLGEKLAALLEAPGVASLQSLVIGAWQADDSSVDASELLERLAAARPHLPALRNLFVGDITSEECEISWVQQADYSALLAAYDQLQHLTVRGGENLTFGTLRHAKLAELVVQTGGLPPAVVHEIASATLPQLTHLELYLGTPDYGGDTTVDDLAPLLSAHDRFPKLRYLGLKDSVIADDVAGVIAGAPVLQQLDVLDLSLGTLGDEGARALLASPAVAKLKKLDLHHHFVSDDLAAELKKLPIEVDLSDRQDADKWGDEEHRFVAVSE